MADVRILETGDERITEDGDVRILEGEETQPAVSTLEFELDGPGGGWTPVSDDVLGAMRLTYGISGHEPNDRVAEPGELTGVLNNEDQRYSLDHANKRAGFDFDIGVRLSLTYNGDTYYKFVGKLVDVDADPGLNGERVTRFRALDWFDDAANEDLPDLEAQAGLRADELLDLILDAAISQPVARAFDAGSDAFPWALDGGAAKGQNKVFATGAQITASEGGRLVIRGDTLTGGVLTLQARQAAATGDVAFTFTDNHITARSMRAPRSRDDKIGRVKVTVHPIREDPAPVVLWSLEATEFRVRAGETLTDVLFGPFRDASAEQGGALVGGTEFEVVDAHTDYELNSQADGGGSDLTDDLVVTPTATGRGVRWTLQNTGVTDGFVTLLQLRGKGIYRRDAVIDIPVPGAVNGRRTLEIDMTFQSNVNVGNTVATYLGAVIPTLQRLEAISSLANVSDDLMLQALRREPNDIIAVRESQTGIDALFVINQVTLDIQPNGLMPFTFGLGPASAAQIAWLLEVAGFGELDETTFLGI